MSGEEIGEVGASNIFFMWKNKNGVRELCTPCLSIMNVLPGTTRHSIVVNII